MRHVYLRAFTLIEILLATVLGVTVMLMAVSVYRSASDVMVDISRQAEVGQTLRAGYFAAMADVDYWHSHADVNFPYLREVNATVRESAAVQPSFAKITLSNDDPDLNTSWIAPHDPRAWYRGYMYSNIISRVPSGSDVTFLFDGTGSGDPTVPDTIGGKRITPRAIYGDYAMLSNILGPGSEDNNANADVSTHETLMAMAEDGNVNYAASVSSQRERTVFYF